MKLRLARKIVVAIAYCNRGDELNWKGSTIERAGKRVKVRPWFNDWLKWNAKGLWPKT